MVFILDAYLLACINVTLPQSLLNSIYFRQFKFIRSASRGISSLIMGNPLIL